MRTLLLLAALPLMAGCATEVPEEAPMALRMVTPGIGDLVLDRGYLRFDDGSELAIQKVADGVYAVPSRPVRTPAGADICPGTPSGYFVLHRTADGLYAMNWGDWMRVPEPPPADIVAMPGACATFTYSAA